MAIQKKLSYKRKIFFCIAVLFFTRCSSHLPLEKYQFFDFEVDYKLRNDSIIIYLTNPLACPLRVNLSSGISYLNQYLISEKIILNPFEKYSLKYPLKERAIINSNPFRYSTILGDPQFALADTSVRYSFPFPPGKSSRILQGYHGDFSHNTPMQEYSIDFEFPLGDTVCAAREGIVVGIIEDYSIGGNNRKYKSYANYVIIYHDDGTMAQYVHLEKNSVLVEIGDKVKKKQPIALVGLTGFTTTPHLHFNVILPIDGGGISIPIKFEKIDGKNIRPKMIVFSKL
jgi:murein DD-endopeptidase MepM/ murein hydrolase activator NlpD